MKHKHVPLCCNVRDHKLSLDYESLGDNIMACAVPVQKADGAYMSRWLHRQEISTHLRLMIMIFLNCSHLSCGKTPTYHFQRTNDSRHFVQDAQRKSDDCVQMYQQHITSSVCELLTWLHGSVRTRIITRTINVLINVTLIAFRPRSSLTNLVGVDIGRLQTLSFSWTWLSFIRLCAVYSGSRQRNFRWEQ